MAPFKNPFNRRPPPLNDENARPSGPGAANPLEGRPSYSSSHASSAVSIKRDKEPDEFKMSVVNDSGVYLPPSPPEQRSFWQRTPTSTTVSSHRSVFSENEPFSISRESFDSYRRSFDISARSPVTHADGLPSRQSFDSYAPRTPRSAVNQPGRFGRPEPQAVDEEKFEEVGLADEAAKPSKKRGIFARFGESNEPVSAADEPARPNSSHRGFHLPGRKRGQSGQGAELRNMDRSPAQMQTTHAEPMDTSA